jgi:hypothetical protein
MDDSRLTELLTKKRSSLKAGLVDAVMAQAVSDADKAERIEMIDLLPDVPPPKPRPAKGVLMREERPEPPRPSRPAKSEPPPLIDPDLDETDRVEHRRRHLGRPPGVSGFWRYLFFERSRMATWGARTNTLIRGILPWTLKISPEASQFASTALSTEILPVLEQNLPRFLSKAWKTMEKYEYNLLAALRPLCQVLAAMTVGPKGPLPAQWDPVLPAITVFWAGQGVVAKTIDAWNQACVKLGATDVVRLGGQDSLRTLLESRSDRVSLPDFLRALLMLRSRRAVDWPELLPRDEGDYFTREIFDCPAEVQTEINRAIGVLKGQLEPVDRDFAEVRRIRYFLPRGRLLDDFAGPEINGRAAWCLQFLERAEPFTPLLSGTVTLQGGERTVLFRDVAMTSALTRLGVLHTQLSATEHDPDLPSAVARVITNLGKLIVIQIRDRSLAADPLIRNPRPSEVTDPLPLELAVIERPSFWMGMTVIDALVNTARLCLLTGRLLGDTSLESALEKEEPLKTRAREILHQLKRLARPADLADTLAVWNAALNETSAGPDDGVAPEV